MIRVPHAALREGLLEDVDRPVFATVSGAHLYGFESPDSDVDLRGAFSAPRAALLGLRTEIPTKTVMRVEDGVELDWVAHEVRKTVRLCVTGSGEVLEQVHSPLVLRTGPWHEELVELARACEPRAHARHNRGIRPSRRARLDGPPATLKALLYAYRSALTGVHVLEGGGIEASLPALLAERPQAGVCELIERKRIGAEKEPLEEGEAERHRGALDALQRRLDALGSTSSLPAALEPGSPGWRARDDFLVRIRPDEL